MWKAVLIRLVIWAFKIMPITWKARVIGFFIDKTIELLKRRIENEYRKD
jgi:hypothetical protein